VAVVLPHLEKGLQYNCNPNKAIIINLGIKSMATSGFTARTDDSFLCRTALVTAFLTNFPDFWDFFN
jgi:hypothetical protein